MEGLDFLRQMGEQQKQIIAQNNEMLDLFKKFLARPATAPVVNIGYKELASEFKKLYGDPTENISKANEEFKSTVNQFGRMASDVPRQVYMKGEFYGFSSWKPFVLYLLFLVGAIGFGTYSWFYNSDDETVRRLTKNRDVLDERILSLKEKNLITASIYFPEYLTPEEKNVVASKKRKK